jgi:16S rRNA (cytosine967-C5)-methyltransferase
VPHLKHPADVARLAVIQERLLRAAIDMLRPGGTLVYCTCSLEPEEGPRQVEALLRSGAPIERRPLSAAELEMPAEWLTEDGDLRTLPFYLSEHDGLDGFYGARLVKRSEAA